MDDSLSVAVDDCIEDWHHKRVHVFLVKRILFQKLLEELASLHQLHDKAVVPLVLISVNKLNDVGVVNGRQNTDFVLHAHYIVLVHLALRQNFNGHFFL